MSNPDEHLSFRVGVFDLLHSNDFVLPENLDGVEPSVVTRFDEMNSTKGSSSEADFEAKRRRRRDGGRDGRERRGERKEGQRREIRDERSSRAVET